MKFMLIDDNVKTLKSMELLLWIRGFSCSTFSDPFKAVQSYSKSEFDAVLTDYSMPGINGIEVMKRINEINQDAKVLLISGCLEKIQSSEDDGIKPYALFSKPLDSNRLLKLISSLDQELKT